MNDRIINSLKSRLIPVFLLLASAMSASAQLQLGADMQPRSVPLGEPTEFQVRVRGNGQYGTPKVKTDPSITIKSGATQSSFTMNFGGQRTSDKTYSFLLYPSKLGEFKVEAEVPIEGDSLLTDAFTLTVRKKTLQEKQREPFLKLSTDVRNVYVGQSIPVEATLFVSEGSRLRSTRTTPEVMTSDFVPEPFLGPLYGEAKVPNYEPFDFTTNVTALKSGDLSFGPVTLDAVIDIPYGPRMIRKQLKLQSDPLKITVKPLPSEGKPVSFKGAIGSFKISMDAEPLKLTQGDPISLTLDIEGVGNFPGVTMPDLQDTKGWKPYPARKFENNDRRTNRTVGLTFTQVLVPLAMKEEIPPFEFTYFDPDQEKYITLKTDAIPIEVSPSAAPVPVANSDGTATTPSAPVTPDASTPVADMTDILGITPIADFGTTAPPVPIYKTKTFWVAQSLPLGAFALMFLFFVREKRLERAPRKKKSNVPEFAEQFQKLRHGSAGSATEFLQLASSALDSWEYHAERTIATLGDPNLEKEAHEIREHFGVLKFGGDPDATALITAEERQKITATLTKLQEYAPAH